MKKNPGGWLLIFGGLGIGLALWLAPQANASGHESDATARRDFDGLVRSVSERYRMHAKTIPMMWLANICARSITQDGVHGMKVVEFEDAVRIAETEHGGTGFGDLVRERLGERWSPLVRSHEAKGGDSFVYAQNDGDGKHTRLIVLDLDGSELNMVTVILNPDQLAKWTKEQAARSEHHRDNASSGNAAD